jgi:hypothetical protein
MQIYLLESKTCLYAVASVIEQIKLFINVEQHQKYCIRMQYCNKKSLNFVPACDVKNTCNCINTHYHYLNH